MKAIIKPIFKKAGDRYGFDINFDTQEEAQRFKDGIKAILTVYKYDVDVRRSIYDKEEK